RVMSRRVILIIAVVLLACAPVVAGIAAVAFVGPGKAILWAQRQYMRVIVRGGPEVALEVDANAVRRRSYELLRRSVVYWRRTAKLTFNTRLSDAGVEVLAQEADREAVINVLRGKLASSVEIRLADDGVVHVDLTDALLARWRIEAADQSQALLTARF